MDKQEVFNKAIRRIAQVTLERKQLEQNALMAEMIVTKMEENGATLIHDSENNVLMILNDKLRVVF